MNQPLTRISDLPDELRNQALNQSYAFNPELQTLLEGKALLPEEIPHSLKEIHEHYENGCLIYTKGVQTNRGRPCCTRCGNQDSALFATFPCSRCGEDCTYCRKCIMMGRVSQCSPLIQWTGPSKNRKIESFEWEGTLSQGQQTASDKVVQAITQNTDLLVWAVCGAGKTEVLFNGIHQALKNEKRVCIATPRTDVILELLPRLQKVFPAANPIALYGGSDDRHKHSQLVLTTTHQLYRYHSAFDVTIVDEVDAFPYSFDQTLQFAVKKARKLQSSLIYLTATPDSKLQREAKYGKRNTVTIPARYHRHPLPVPSLKWCGNWKPKLEKGRLPAPITRWTEARITTHKQALIFLPSVKTMKKALPLFQKLHPGILSVHAEDPERKEKVQKMRDGEIPILLTTTILERGVTIPNIDVAVMGAEEDIFTESALVQIAGRVGRSARHPSGDITFFHYGKTLSMIKAIHHIKEMNRQGVKRGLLSK
ncbi:DNA/RNA helicase [Bacillus salacetis]|uniref:DNA/RNA helicase n=2 Tax=Bacillus salacetis TaxID=2315464 RepID=A0A3A1R7B2_9BACI|nr:DEAD/DEAH box helicase [Bacillus salacetis]RIW39111.1 DNA/RNA helicase [Bacillus salacetis]